VIAGSVGSTRTIAALVDFDADYLEPGRIAYLGTGTVAVGELEGQITNRAMDVAASLGTTGSPVHVTSNIVGLLWSKLAYTAMVAATATTDVPMADCFDWKPASPVFQALAGEVLEVAIARGLTVESFGPFDPSDALARSDSQWRRALERVAATARQSSKKHSGIWRDLAIRRRPTEVPALFEPVIRAAEESDVATPHLVALLATVAEIEAARRPRSVENLVQLGVA
jgi:2-dehydropantoate 2-reductase